MKYSPDYIPNDADARFLVEYLTRELNKIAQTLDHPEATAINYGKEVQNVASTSAITVNWKRGQKQRIIFDASSTITFIPPEGVCNLMLVLDYNGTYTPTLPSSMLWTGGTEPTWTKTNGAIDVIAMYYDGTYYHATASVDSK
jgi:hypothetical protein